MSSLSVDLSLNLQSHVEWDASQVEMRHRAIDALQVGEAYVIKCPPDRDIDALPGVADIAMVLIVAMAVAGTAFGNRDGAFQRVDDFRSADLLWLSGQTVAAVRAACRVHQFRFRKRFQ